MSQTIPVEQAAAHLAELVATLQPGDEITLTSQDRPVARIISDRPVGVRPRRQAGMWKGVLTILQDDDEHLRDFEDYMP